MNFTEFWECPVNFVLKYGTLILTEWNITITLLHSYRNTQQWQVHDVTATVGKTPPYGAVQNLKICRRNDVLLNFTEF